MVAVIMAAGKGRRIAELANGLPKSFLTLGKKRIIDHQIEALSQIGVKKKIIVIGYKSELFEEEYNRKDFVLIKNPFYDRTNVLASIWFARDYIREGFYFMHADTFFDSDILCDLQKEKGDIVLAVNKKKTIPEDMKVKFDGEKIVEINKEMACGEAFGEFTGLAKVNKYLAPKIVQNICNRIEKQGRHDDFFELVIQDLIDQKIRVSNFDIGNRLSIEIDFPEDYEEAKLLYQNKDYQ